MITQRLSIGDEKDQMEISSLRKYSTDKLIISVGEWRNYLGKGEVGIQN